MKQAIPGVAPPDAGEVTVMTVWPTIAATSLGCTMGRAFMISVGLGNVLTLGNIAALLSIPVAIPLFFFVLLLMGRYRLTNRRVIIEKGPKGVEERSISLDDFDAIDVVVLPGQEWYPAGELIFRKGNIESLRLHGVSRPETFRQTCLKAQRSYAGVKRALEMQAV
jgi:hypothetical protein